MIVSWLIVSALQGIASSEIMGKPIISCTPEGVKVSMNMSEPFGGHIYLKGHYGKKECHADFRSNKVQTANTQFAYDACVMRRKRQANPRGLMMSSLMVVAHHDTLITWRDRAFRIECFYRENNSQVNTKLQVSGDMPSSTMLAEQALPSCEYKMNMDSTAGAHDISSGWDNSSVVSVGQSVLHVWTCANNVPNDVYCMQVHSCLADDGSGKTVNVVDSLGCTIDEMLLSSIRYDSSLRATAASRVFKFADKTVIYFKCQIKLSNKHEYANHTCLVPTCEKRSKRSITVLDRSARGAPSFDVYSPSMTVVEGGRVAYSQPITQTPEPCPWITVQFVIVLSILVIYFIFSLCMILNLWRRIQDPLLAYY